ncbi:hypothetical protein [Methyloligella solikamskensis]|uniref:Uncharacterized protein n=1 Tax=Methyloligella solikamskensis TaxID=1177756 RepID=A0ABW3J8F5_9HYPH
MSWFAFRVFGLGRGCVATLVLACISIATTSAARADCENPQVWRTYHNDRFGTEVMLPVDCLEIQPPPANGDGQTFVAPNGVASVSVFGSHNSTGSKLGAIRQSMLAAPAYGEVTYSPSGSNWFVLSGYRDNAIYYDKYILSHDGQILNGMLVTYSPAVKEMFEPIVERMENTFKAGVGIGTP